MAAESALKTLQRHTLSASVYASIKQAIISGELPPGSRITEKMLEQTLGVSRSPVREAIARLAQEGYLIGKAYKGYRVNHPTAREVREIYEVLIALTELSLTLAMQRADDEQLSELLALVEAMERGLAEGRISEYGVAVANFRRRAVAFSQNETLARLYDQLVNQPAHIKLWAIDDLIAVKRRAPDLTRLRLALLEGDGATAGRVMADKMQRALNDVLAELEEKEANMSR